MPHCRPFMANKLAATCTDYTQLGYDRVILNYNLDTIVLPTINNEYLIQVTVYFLLLIACFKMKLIYQDHQK